MTVPGGGRRLNAVKSGMFAADVVSSRAYVRTLSKALDRLEALGVAADSGNGAAQGVAADKKKPP